MNKSISATMLTILLAVSMTGCASLLSSAMTGVADNISNAMLDQVDPETAKAALPAYIVAVDGALQNDPDNADVLAAGALMYATYGGVFATEPVRASRLTKRARSYAQRAMCIANEASCDWPAATYEDFVASLQEIESGDTDYVYAYGVASLAYLRAHSDDWNSLAELPQIEALFYHYLDISGDEVNSGVYTFMGILLTLRPPALGGEPEKAREFFEKAIALTNGNDLGVKVEYAKGYAKLLYERELHDRLLHEVLAADPDQPGYVLTNVMAQEEAQALLAEADDYF